MAAHKPHGIYGGKDPGDLAAYTIPEAAHHLYLPLATVRSWLFGRSYSIRSGERKHFPPIITLAEPGEQRLSFYNLVELHVLKVIRRVYGVGLPQIRIALPFLKKFFKTERPLLDKRLLTDGKSLLIEAFDEYVNASQGGQLEMKQLLEQYVSRIEWTRPDVPVRLFPFVGSEAEASPRSISIDPRVQFGRPCIAGTGVPTEILAERHAAGDSVALLAEDYGRSQKEIREAIRYESREAA